MAAYFPGRRFVAENTGQFSIPTYSTVFPYLSIAEKRIAVTHSNSRKFSAPNLVPDIQINVSLVWTMPSHLAHHFSHHFWHVWRKFVFYRLRELRKSMLI